MRPWTSYFVWLQCLAQRTTSGAGHRLGPWHWTSAALIPNETAQTLRDSLLVRLSLEQSLTYSNPCWPDLSCAVEISGFSVASIKGTNRGQQCCVPVPCPFRQLLAPQSTVLGTQRGSCCWALCVLLVRSGLPVGNCSSRAHLAHRRSQERSALLP